VSAPPIRDAFVSVRDGRVRAVGPIAERTLGPAVTEIDLGRTILMPGFVNAHTHLELSNLAGAVPGDRGFVAWIEDQLRVRAERGSDRIPAAIAEAIAAMESSGTVAVADVSNSLAAIPSLIASSLHAVVLHEILGVDPAKAAAVADAAAALRAQNPGAPPRVRVEVAAHAPHSISRELFALLASRDSIRSIHVAESRSETTFLRDGGGDWRGFLDRRVGPVPFAAPGLSPVRYLDSLGVLTPGVLAVHCVHIDADDANILADRKAVAVLCPRSNEYLGNGTPPLALLAGSGVALALGTDSLASCSSLDVLDDARFLAKKFARVPRDVIFRALTRGGAEALRFDDLGDIRPGSRTRFAAMAFEGEAPRDPIAFVLNDTAPARGLAA